MLMCCIGKYAFPTLRRGNGSSKCVGISQDPKKVHSRGWVLNICYPEHPNSDNNDIVYKNMVFHQSLTWEKRNLPKPTGERMNG